MSPSSSTAWPARGGVLEREGEGAAVACPWDAGDDHAHGAGSEHAAPSASTKAKVTPRSSVRQRRMPAPRSQPGLRRPQMPQPPVPAPQAHPDDDPSCSSQTPTSTTRSTPKSRSHNVDGSSPSYLQLR
jgi:hypothetical protein